MTIGTMTTIVAERVFSPASPFTGFHNPLYWWNGHPALRSPPIRHLQVPGDLS